MNGELIKSFLVGLGFGVDESSLAKFNKAIESATFRVAALYTSIQVAAAGIFKGISSISESFETMGYEYRIIAPMINKALMLRNALLSAYKAAGINIVKTVQESVKFNFSLAKTKFALEAIAKSVGVRFLPMLTKQMDIFRTKIYANLPKIQAILEKAVSFIFKAFEATARLGERVWSIMGRIYDVLKELDTATGGWSTKIIAVVAAWRLLNLSFLATPLGMIITGIIALLALFDDFKTWQEGGESLFDWSAALPVINAISEGFKSMFNIVKGVVTYIGFLIQTLRALFNLDMAGFFGGLKSMASAAGDVIGSLVDHIKNIARFLGSAITATAYATAPSGHNSPYFNTTNFASPQPLMPSSSSSSQKVSQETNINVMGSADASATAKAVSSQQNQVNMDMTRNLKGATR